MGYRMSTPINVMMEEAKEMSLNIRLNLSTAKFVLKSMASKFSLVYRSLENMEMEAIRRKQQVSAVKESRLFKQYVTTRAEKSIVYRSTYPPAFWHSYEVYSLRLQYISVLKGCDKKDNTDMIKVDFYHKSFHYRQDATCWYTDGSKNQSGCVGAAVFSLDPERYVRHKLPPETSVFTAELWAILQAVYLIGDTDTKRRNVVFSDSESALEALSNTSSIHHNYLVYYIKQAYLRVTNRDKEITFFWVPAHAGIPGNESADRAAKGASTEGFTPPFKIPYQDLLTETVERAKAQTRENMRLVSSSKGTMYYDNYYNPCANKTWFHSTRLSREEIVLINRLRSNHVNVNESLSRVNIVESAACPCGDPYQSINHLLFNCSLFNLNSAPIRKYITHKFPNSRPDILPALRSPSPKLCRLLLAYMKANELFF